MFHVWFKYCDSITDRLWIIEISQRSIWLTVFFFLHPSWFYIYLFYQFMRDWYCNLQLLLWTNLFLVLVLSVFVLLVFGKYNSLPNLNSPKLFNICVIKPCLYLWSVSKCNFNKSQTTQIAWLSFSGFGMFLEC